MAGDERPYCLYTVLNARLRYGLSGQVGSNSVIPNIFSILAYIPYTHLTLITKFTGQPHLQHQHACLRLTQQLPHTLDKDNYIHVHVEEKEHMSGSCVQRRSSNCSRGRYSFGGGATLQRHWCSLEAAKGERCQSRLWAYSRQLKCIQCQQKKNVKTYKNA